MEKRKAVIADLYQKICFLTVPQHVLRDIVEKSQISHLQAIIKE